MARTLELGKPVVLMMDGDAGRTLGGILKHEFDVASDIVSIDGVQLRDHDYVDIGEMIHPTEVVPLIIKSLLFATPESAGRDGAAAHLEG